MKDAIMRFRWYSHVFNLEMLRSCRVFSMICNPVMYRSAIFFLPDNKSVFKAWIERIVHDYLNS